MNRTHLSLMLLAGALVAAVPFVARAQTGTPARASGAIEGAVFEDANGNEVFDLDESGVQGVTLRLAGEDLDRTTKTDEGGLYRFAGIQNGTYTVRIDVSDGYTATERTEYEGLEVSGDTLASVDFALRSEEASDDEPGSLAATDEVTATETTTDTLAAYSASTTPEPAADTSGEATAEATADGAAGDTPLPTVDLSAMASANPMAALMATAMALTPPAGVAPAQPAYGTPMPYGQPGAGTAPPVAPAPVTGQMPQTGVEDLGVGGLLAVAVAVLLALALAGWAVERRS
jgi:hypothetical protein